MFDRTNFARVLLAALAALVVAGPSAAEMAPKATARITANAVSFNPANPNYFGSFAPELQQTLDKVPPIDPDTGLYVAEVKPGLFYVTEGVYQSAFLKTDEGVVVFDAPPSFAHKLPEAIREHAPGAPIKYLIYSHDHADHIGGADIFSGVAGLEVVAAAPVAQNLADDPLRGVIAPTMTFEDSHALTIGGARIEMRTASFHSEDADVVIYLPQHKFIMAVDTITPGEVPFMNFGATSDVGRYLKAFDTILAYDFDLILSGHVSILGTRSDVLEAKEYAFDVRDAVLSRMGSFLPRMEKALAVMDYKNPNLAYRAAMEEIRDECAAGIIEKWQDRLSVVDVWADSHCETILLYSIMH